MLIQAKISKLNKTAIQKFGATKLFTILKKLSYAHHICIYLIKRTIKKQ